MTLTARLGRTLTTSGPGYSMIVYAPFVRLTSMTNILSTRTVNLNTRGYTSGTSNTCAKRISTTVIGSANTRCIVLNRSRHHTCCNRATRVLGRGMGLTLTGNLGMVFYVKRILRRHRTRGRGRIMGTRLTNSLFSLATRRFTGVVLTCRPI